MNKKNIVLIFGGESTEHEVSIITAKQVYRKFNFEKYNVYPIYIDKKHEFKYIKDFSKFETFKDFVKLKKIPVKISLYKGKASFYIGSIKKITQIDAILPTFHGGEGENGQIQGFFDLLKIPYTGPNIKGALFGIDKIITKYILEENNIEIVPWMYILKDDWENNRDKCIERIKKEIGYPAIVKPNSLGSSIGVKKVTTDSELEDIIDTDILFDEKIIIEKFKDDVIEITYSLMKNNNEIELSLSEEIEKDLNIVYSYEDKYLQEGGKKSKTNEGMAGSKRKVPAKINKNLDESIRNTAKQIYKLLDGQSLARIDFLVDQKNNKFYPIEINTIPGSLSFYLWEATGVQFSEIIDKLIDNAIKDFNSKDKFIKNIDSPLWNT